MVRALALAVAASALLAGCSQDARDEQRAAGAANAAANALDLGATAEAALPTDAWIVRWTGPEGLFLDIRHAPGGAKGRYAIVNKDSLDRQADYQGIADGATIRFVRDGKDVALRPGSGEETGFKWLADKSDCLIVEAGKEGYCR